VLAVALLVALWLLGSRAALLIAGGTSWRGRRTFTKRLALYEHPTVAEEAKQWLDRQP
jgi:hypothetical protein